MVTTGGTLKRVGGGGEGGKWKVRSDVVVWCGAVRCGAVRCQSVDRLLVPGSKTCERGAKTAFGAEQLSGTVGLRQVCDS